MTWLSIVARRRLSQVFLKDKRVVFRLVEQLPPPVQSKTVLEIGPGAGAVTRCLVDAGYDVVAVEVDEYWARNLERQSHKIRIVQTSILDVSPAMLVHVPAVVVGSLPYHLSGAILRWLADWADDVSTAVLILQEEVVQRMAAKPGSRQRGLLGIVMQSVYDVRPLFRIHPRAFFPVPKVWSRAVDLKRPPQAKSVEEMRGVWEAARVLFRHRRKMIRGILERTYGREIRDRASQMGLDLTQRPENLTFAELETLRFAVSGSR